MVDKNVIKPDAKLKMKYIINTLLIFIFFIFPFIFLGLIPELGGPYAGTFLAANVLWILPTLALIPVYCHSLKYELRDEEIVVHKGIITKRVDTVPYSMITNIAIKRGPIDRLMGLGGLAIHTAGYSGQNAGPEASLVGLADYEAIHEQILSAVRRRHAQAQVSTGAKVTITKGTEEGTVAGLLAQILQELRALRGDMEAED